MLTLSIALAVYVCHHHHHIGSHGNLTNVILFSYRQTSWLLDSWVWV
jgi:multisubunit Na+/H+ antiporter MnhB subunit